MDKKRLHHHATKLRNLRPLYLLVVAILSAVVCILALRANNEHMVQLRTALYQADQKGQNVQAALLALQSYVTTHMNTNLSAGSGSVYPPIQLAGTYDRLLQAQGAVIQQQNSQLYSGAQAYCEKLYPTGLSAPRIPCIEQYVQSHGLKTAPTIPAGLYKFDFASPWWSPDLAGWSVVVGCLSLLAAAGLFVLQWLAR